MFTAASPRNRDAALRPSSVAVGQSTGYSKLAAASASTSTAPDWLWSEDRKLLPTVFQEIQALCGHEFTLDAAATDSGDNAHCTNSCSPSNSFMSKTHTGHIRINAPFTQLTNLCNNTCTANNCRLTALLLVYLCLAISCLFSNLCLLA